MPPAPAVGQRSEITDELGDLARTVNDLDNELAQLYTALDPILGPNANDEGSAVGAPRPLSAVGQTIRDINDRAYSMQQSLRVIKSRLALAV